MSHYCCKRCGRRYDDCDCGPLLAATPNREAAQAPAVTRTWQHDETGRLCDAAESPGPRWHEVSPATVKESLQVAEGAAQAPVGAVPPEPTEEQVAMLDPWMRPAAARELLRRVLAAAPSPATGAEPLPGQTKEMP